MRKATAFVLLLGFVIAGAVTWAGLAAGSTNWDRGDLNCNGAVDPGDALEVLKYDAGLRNDLPSGCPPIGPSPSPSPTQPANNLPQPQQTGPVAAGGKARVVIDNDSPFSMTVDFSGPESRHLSLPACGDCIEYFFPPFSCPEKGPQMTVDLEPGTYQVEVVSGKDGVLPFRGTWTLEADTGYFDCFIILKSFGS
jgi:hypothetical protein